ncbi:non-hydrolyzing UDP-N-acetylglucosamine 2-epimerase, partial [Helicobacter bizzozeronii]|uniref:non-hydrolyzing UDP-N-acetylglucosamine 2-epimerase n=1 Tax=Helicobacter bizzozeronii TaxID=56877 RepID=UPI000CEDD936
LHTLPQAPPNLTPLKHIAFMFAQLKEFCQIQRPDYILVYGDTNSTLAGALCAYSLKIPLIHIEAGLRSGDLSMPEERNRILTDQLSTLLFCPTPSAYACLKQEQHLGQKIYFSGDVMLDNVRFFAPKAHPPKPPFEPSKKPFIFATWHRASNIDNQNNLQNIFKALEYLAQNMPLFLALHPRTQNALAQCGLSFKNVSLLPPLSYLETLYMLTHARLVLTDSGGLQKEACFLGTPVLVMRENSEYPELLEGGGAILVGTHADLITRKAQELLTKGQVSFANIDHFGKGASALHILQAIKEHACYLGSSG